MFYCRARFGRIVMFFLTSYIENQKCTLGFSVLKNQKVLYQKD